MSAPRLAELRRGDLLLARWCLSPLRDWTLSPQHLDGLVDGLPGLGDLSGLSWFVDGVELGRGTPE